MKVTQRLLKPKFTASCYLALSMLIAMGCKPELKKGEAFLKPDKVLGEIILKDNLLLDRNVIEVRADTLRKLLDSYVVNSRFGEAISIENGGQALLIKVRGSQNIKEFHQDLMDISDESGANPEQFFIYQFKNLDEFFPGTVGSDTSFTWSLPISYTTDSLSQVQYVSVVAEVIIRLKQLEQF